ncbi:MAG: YcaO-like family protein [Oscillospiraceae bacterium]|nr:YcaO-like family protein [Oscillospiraceae bacterium]
MKYIDEKFKDVSPEATVETIRSLLKAVGIDIHEDWHDSGLEHCHSLTVHSGPGFPGANGKGISREFARASAYGEFMERLQSGLFFYKYQSFECDPAVNLQCYAPDGKYFTKDELLAQADWFDCLTESYAGLTKQALADQCEMYAHTDDGRILCIPFYSLFEDRYVYLPAGFAEHMYSANGCCVGNTKEEALVHALSEIMERKASITAIQQGKSFPQIPEEVLQSFPTVSKILARLRECDNLDVAVFDCSIGNGFPVISTRIINKDSHGYLVNFAADPVLEIAIQRTLTEMFQGRNLETVAKNDGKPILTSAASIRTAANVLNQLENGRGLFCADYFADELTCDRSATRFEDNSSLTNRQLLDKMLGLYRQLGKPVLVRNYNFLGFPCYKVIVPGFSESRGMKLTEKIQEYALGHQVSQILRNPKAFAAEDYSLIFMLNKMLVNAYSRRNNFAFLSGLPIASPAAALLWNVTMAYCALRSGNLKDALLHTDSLSKKESLSADDRRYFACVKQYLSLQDASCSDEVRFSVLGKFNKACYVEQLKKNLAAGSPFDEYLLACDGTSCHRCRYKDACRYEHIKTLIANAGKVYREFTHGQDPENFIPAPQ